MRPRLLLADDHTLMIEGIRLLLEPEFDVVGLAADGREVLEAAMNLRPDVIILDIAMPFLNGIDAARQLRKILPTARLMFLSMQEDPDYITEAFRAGASAYIPKRAAASELVTAIRETLEGNQYLSPLVARKAMESWVAGSPAAAEFKDQLTPRRREILRLVAEGKSRKEIAWSLHISVKTVEFHKAVLSRDLRLKTTADFTRYAIESGIITAQREERPQGPVRRQG